MEMKERWRREFKKQTHLGALCDYGTQIVVVA